LFNQSGERRAALREALGERIAILQYVARDSGCEPSRCFGEKSATALVVMRHGRDLGETARGVTTIDLASRAEILEQHARRLSSASRHASFVATADADSSIVRGLLANPTEDRTIVEPNCAYNYSRAAFISSTEGGCVNAAIDLRPPVEPALPVDRSGFDDLNIDQFSKAIGEYAAAYDT
jgi:hypothetical protein